MSKTKRLLSVLLAAVMVFTTMAVGASALPSYSIDGALSYDNIDNPVLTVDQCSTMMLDYLDEELAEEGDDLVFEIGNISLDARSIDNALDSIWDIRCNEAIFTELLLGKDLVTLDVSAISTHRRASAGNTDTDLLYDVLTVFSANAELLSKIFDWSIDLGQLLNTALAFIPAEYMEIVENIPAGLKKILYNYLNNTENQPVPADVTMDTMVQDLIDDLIVQFVPSLANENLDIADTSVYDVLRVVAEAGINEFGVPELNGNVLKYVREFCGVTYVKGDPDNGGNESNLNAFADILDIHYEVTPYYFSDSSANIMDELNNLAAHIINEMLVDDVWETGGNEKILDNLAAVARLILDKAPEVFEGFGVELPSEEEIAGMTSVELFTEAAFIIVESLVDYIYIDYDNCTSLRGLVTYALMTIAADFLPVMDYQAMIEDGKLDPNTNEGILMVATDRVVYFMNGYLNIDLEENFDVGESVLSFDEFLNEVVDYALSYIPGLVDTTDFTATDSAWDKFDKVVFDLLPLDEWLNIEGSEDLVMNKFVDSVFELDFENLVSIFTRKEDKNAPLYKGATNLLITVVMNLFNEVFPGTFANPESIDCFEDLMTQQMFKSVVKNLLLAIGAKKKAIVDSLIPLAVIFMDFADPQELEPIEVDAPKAIVLSNGAIPAGTQMTITNTSEGLNTAWTNANGEFAQDQLYKYVITSVAVSSNTVKVTNNGIAISEANPVTINGGKSVTLDITGTAANFTPITFEIVYDITEEHGEKLIENGVAYAYSFVTNTASDAGLNSRTKVNNFELKDLKRYVYTSSLSGFEQTLRIEHEYDDGAYNGGGTVTSVVVEGDLPDGLIVNTDVNETLRAVEGEDDVALVYIDLILKDDTYVRPEGEEPQYGTYNVNLGVVINGTKITVPVTFCYYNGAGLSSLVKNCQEENLQPIDFTGGATSAEWKEYKDALTYAAGIANIPFNQSILDKKLPYMEGAATRLAEARAALNELQVSSGKATLGALLDEYEGNADNDDIPLADRNYFGREDFILYTYLRYKDYSHDAEKAAEKKNLDSIDATYAIHKLKLYHDRLVARWPDTLQLEYAVARFEEKEYDETLYTEASWARMMEAYDYALYLIDLFYNSDEIFDEYGNPNLDVFSQSQINVTRRALIVAENALAVDTGEMADYTQLDAYIEEAEAIDTSLYTPETVEILENVLAAAKDIDRELTYDLQGEVDEVADLLRKAIDNLKEIEVVVPSEPVVSVVDGSTAIIDADYAMNNLGLETVLVYGLAEYLYDASEYITVENGTIEYTYVEGFDGQLGTGTVITAYDNDGNVFAEYTVVIFGDYNGDGIVDTEDTGYFGSIANFEIFDYFEMAHLFAAADVNGDLTVDAMDDYDVNTVANYEAYIDQTVTEGTRVFSW